jgi:hypothetical protein
MHENCKVEVEESDAVTSTHPSLASSPHELCNDAMCTIHAPPPPVLRPDWETISELLPGEASR